MESICRACRVPIGSAGIALVDNSELYQRPFWEMMYECTRIEITMDDDFPKNICGSCLKRLETSFEFITMCRQSVDFFFSALGVVKQEPYPETQGDGNCEPDFELPDMVKQEPEAVEHTEDNSLLVPLEMCAAMVKATLPTTRPMRLTPAIVKKQRELSRRRQANRRANYTEKQLKDEKELNRIRTAVKRASRTQEEIQQDKERQRQRIALKRANRTPEETEAERQQNKIRAAMRRAAMKEVELTSEGSGADAC